MLPHVFPTRHNLEVSLSNHNGKQVIAPFLIVLRVANRTALTSETVLSGNVGTIHFRSEGTSMNDSGTVTIPGEDPMCSVDADGVTADEPGFRDGTAADEAVLGQSLKLKGQ